MGRANTPRLAALRDAPPQDDWFNISWTFEITTVFFFGLLSARCLKEAPLQLIAKLVLAD